MGGDGVPPIGQQLGLKARLVGHWRLYASGDYHCFPLPRGKGSRAYSLVAGLPGAGKLVRDPGGHKGALKVAGPGFLNLLSHLGFYGLCGGLGLASRDPNFGWHPGTHGFGPLALLHWGLSPTIGRKGSFGLEVNPLFLEGLQPNGFKGGFSTRGFKNWPKDFRSSWDKFLSRVWAFGSWPFAFLNRPGGIPIDGGLLPRGRGVPIHMVSPNSRLVPGCSGPPWVYLNTGIRALPFGHRGKGLGVL